MDDKVNFDYTKLLPERDPLLQLLQGTVSSEGISSLVIAVQLVIFVGFLIYVCWVSVRARRSITTLHKRLRGITSDKLLEKRQDLKFQVDQRNKRLGKLWSEFDETLVVSEGSKQLQNTYDAAYFFNTHSLARGISESRLLAAVPGFLTALGIFGTFVGLLLGLSKINPDDVSSITPLIAGASLAFKTSVWGVSFSLVFNIIEKYVEQSVRHRIADLQDQIDGLFPRVHSEQTLVDVHEEVRQARNTLEGLSERIGDRMQEAVTQVAQHVQTSVIEGLQQILQPAFASLERAANDLADRQARGGAEALESLIEQFSAGIKGQGDHHRVMMEETTVAVTNAIGQWNGSMVGFVTHLEELNERMDARETTRAASLEQHLQASQTTLVQSQKLQQQIESITHGLQTSAAEIRTSSELLSHAAGGLRVLANRLQTGVQQLDGTLHRVLEQTRALSEENAATGRNINEVLSVITNLQSTFRATAETIVEAATISRVQTAELADHQQQLSKALEDHIEQLQQQVARLLTDYANQVQVQTHDRLNEWNKQTRQFAETMESAVNSIASVVEEIEDKLGR